MAILMLVGALRVAAAPLIMELRTTWDGAPIHLDGIRYQTPDREAFSITRFSMLLSNFAVQQVSGAWQEQPDVVAWIDASARLTTFSLGELPAGTYRALRFDVGLSPEINHGDPTGYPDGHPLNPLTNRLHWDWQTGYIFMAVEGLIQERPNVLNGYVFHLANDPNRTRIELAMDLDASFPSRVSLDVDLQRLFFGIRPIGFSKAGTSTHSRPEDSLAAAIKTNLATLFSVRRIVSAAPAAQAAPPKAALYLPAHPEPYRFTMRKTFPFPSLPLDNPLLKARVELGRRLFADTRLSGDGAISCQSCHDPARAFTDGLSRSVGTDGRSSLRNSMPLFNLAWKNHFFWDGRVSSLREQMRVPLQDHREMDAELDVVLSALQRDPEMQAGFTAAFGSEGITDETLGLALENFQLTLVSSDSRFDRAMAGGDSLSAEERRGLELFFTEYEPRSGRLGADCFHCHGGALFTDQQFHNNGLEPVGFDRGRGDITGRRADQNRFSTPSLRNVALTAPYMHDGRFDTLEEVIAHYNGPMHRSETLDPNLAKHPVQGLQLPAEDQQALVAFLRSLTDPQYRSDDRKAD